MIDSRKIHWGILSTARVNRRVVPAIQASLHGMVVAIASRDLARAQAVAQQYAIPRVCDSYEMLLADDGIDAVYLPLPNSLHREWTIRAAQAGKHVLCEKPLGLSAAECAEMQSACQDNKVLLMEALSYHFHPQIMRCRELVKTGTIGPVRLVRSAFSFLLSDASNIRLQRDLGGGVLFDAGCYCVSLARLMVGEEPVEAFAFAEFGKKTQVDETLAGALRFPGGVIASFDCSFRTQFRHSVEVVGSAGKIDITAPFLPRLADTTLVIRRDDDIETLVIAGTDQHLLMIEHFNDCVINQHVPIYPAQDAVHNMRAIDMLYASVRHASQR